MNDQNNCPKCHKVCLLPVEIPCKHIMCFLCVKALVLTGEKNCLSCNQTIPSDYLHNIVLVNYDILYETPDSCCWQYKGRNGWWMYDERSNSIIEKEYDRKTANFELTIGAYAYIIDFLQSKQFRCDNLKLGRSIRRESQRKGDILGVAGVKFPNILKQSDMIAYNENTKKIQSITNTDQESEVPPETPFWFYQLNDKWSKFDENYATVLEYDYKTFLDDDQSEIVKRKVKNQEYDLDFKNWIIKNKTKNEVIKVMRKLDDVPPDVTTEAQKKQTDETLVELKNENEPPSAEKRILDINEIKIKDTNENEINLTSKTSKDVNGEVHNATNDLEESIVISNARWYFKNETNNWIGISEKTTKFIEKVYRDYLMNQNNKFETTINEQNYIIDFKGLKGHVQYKKGMDQEQQVLQRSENTNEAESKFNKVIIDRKLATIKGIKSESWYVNVKNEWQIYDEQVCSSLDEAYLTFLKTPESNCYSNEIEGRRWVFDFVQFIVLDCSNMNMQRFKRGSKTY